MVGEEKRAIPFNRPETITLENFDESLYLMKIGVPLNEAEQLQVIINNADNEIRDLLLKHKIDNLKDLKTYIGSSLKEKNNIDNIIKICARRITYEDTPDDYINDISKQLLKKGGSERYIVELLSGSIWPGNERVRKRLRLCDSIENLNNERNQ